MSDTFQSPDFNVNSSDPALNNYPSANIHPSASTYTSGSINPGTYTSGSIDPSASTYTSGSTNPPASTSSTGSTYPAGNTSTSATTIDTDSTAARINATLQSTKDSVVSTAQSTIHSIQNHPTVQQLNNGPLAQNVRDQASLTSTEFQNLADARAKPAAPAATGQPLTQYHSMFYSLMSWENPRATAITFAISVVFIFMTRYLNVLHYAFKFAYFVLGVTAALEIAGKILFDDGLASKMRPRKYYTIPRRSLEASLDEVEQLLNFFVIESQRILYAENVYATIAVFFAALISYGLIKVVPFWGLTLMGTCVMYLAPLVYIKNRELIDGQVEHMTDVVSSQAHQLRDITVHHASAASETVKSYAEEYTHKAQEYMGQKKTSSDFPTAPSSEPTPLVAHSEPVYSPQAATVPSAAVPEPPASY